MGPDRVSNPGPLTYELFADLKQRVLFALRSLPRQMPCILWDEFSQENAPTISSRIFHFRSLIVFIGRTYGS